MRSFILDTDWGEDCDDAVAARILLRHAGAGDIKLLGIGINTDTENAAPSLYSFCKKEGFIVPIGFDKDCPKKNWENRYQPRLAKDTDKKRDDFENAVTLYRKLLSASEDKVEFITIGFLQIIEQLLKSEADEISELTGYELFEKKVSKLWIMGGKWTGQGEREFNLCYTPFACQAANYVVANAPCEITFLGWEIGARLYTGGLLDKEDHLYKALVDWGCPNGRESWDPMTVMLALAGDEYEAGYDVIRIDPVIDPQTGANYFELNPSSKHKFVVKRFENKYYEDLINNEIK